MANLEEEYNGHYALFCKFTHGALRATMGELDDADSFASLCVALNTIRALNLLKKYSASVPELEEHERRLLGLLRVGKATAD